MKIHVSSTCRLRKSACFGLLTLILLIVSCAGSSFRNGVFSNKEVSYQIGPLSSDWQQQKAKGINLVFQHANGKGMLVVHSRCSKEIDEKLENLINDLFLEVNHDEEISREFLTIDGANALRMHHRIVQKIARTETDTVVLKKGKCAFWLQLVASPDVFSQLQSVFVRFLKEFSQRKGGADE